MKRAAIAFTGAMLAVSVNMALADRIGGSPKADFHTDELIIPCVKITGLSDATEGTYLDVVLSRRGKSFNYALSAAEREDVGLCEKIANFAEFEDDDFDDPNDDDNADVADILVECEVSSDRSEISVEGKNLGGGGYYAVLTSGDRSAESDQQESIGDEVEFEFDSNAEEIEEGAVEIDADFITGEEREVTGEIFLVGDAEPLLSETVRCSLDD
ncbi:MAG: hypothetical protein WBN68_06540 [Sedimenticolaceae bacterium]